MGFLTNPSVDEIVQCSGYLFWNPTNLASEATWGTKLGFVDGGVVFQPGYQVVTVTQEETGQAVYKKIYTGATPVISGVLKSWNSTVIGALFPGLASGASVKITNSFKPGSDLSSTSYCKPLLYVPQDTTNHPCVLFQKACPNIVETAKLILSHTKRMTFPFVFDALNKTSDADGTAYFGLLSGATLR